jgi:hypothetical protein
MLLIVPALMIIGVQGCTKGYRIKVSGTAKSAADGKPIAGAKVVLKVDGSSSSNSPVTTGPDGHFAFAETTASSDTCAVQVSASGYADEEVGLSPGEGADSSGSYRVLVAAALRPAEPADALALKRIGGKVRWAGTGPGDGAVAIALAGNEVTYLALSSLKSVPTLRELTIEGPNLTDTLLRDLASLPELKSLELVATDHITDAGLAELRRALPDLVITRR